MRKRKHKVWLALNELLGEQGPKTVDEVSNSIVCLCHCVSTIQVWLASNEQLEGPKTVDEVSNSSVFDTAAAQYKVWLAIKELLGQQGPKTVDEVSNWSNFNTVLTQHKVWLTSTELLEEEGGTQDWMRSVTRPSLTLQQHNTKYG